MAQPGRPAFRILIDFDSTLFDTSEFRTDLWTEIARLTGKTLADIEADSPQFYLDPKLGGYDMDNHLRHYNLNVDLMWRYLDEMLSSKDYLYLDSRPFIEELRAHGFDPSILSYGGRRLQTAKIAPYAATMAGDGRPVPYDIILSPKGPYIGMKYPGEHGMLIDDVPDQHLPESFLEINLLRGSNLKLPEKVAGRYKAADLEQTLKIIIDTALN